MALSFDTSLTFQRTGTFSSRFQSSIDIAAIAFERVGIADL